MSWRACLLLPVLMSGCIAGHAGRVGEPASGGVQAALAVVTVENRTAHELTISFRAVGPQRGVVTVGRVAPGITRRMPPVPANEPIILRAQRPDSALLELPLRTFQVNEAWLWVIPADARFQ